MGRQPAHRDLFAQQALDEHLLGALGVLALHRLGGDRQVADRAGQALADARDGIELIVLHPDDGPLGPGGLDASRSRGSGASVCSSMMRWSQVR
jgi:hypothetical protein